MARDMQSIVKQSRREGYALHPKAHKVLVRRANTPGEQGARGTRGRSKASQYSIQLREKQKVKRLYGLLEKQFAKLMKEAAASKGQPGAVLLEYLERRLDNAVYRAGFSTSRRGSRQLVSHGHFTLNGRRVDVPSIRLKPGDEFLLRDGSKANSYFTHLDELSPAPTMVPTWLKVNRKKVGASVSGVPTRDDAEPDIKEQLIIEFYSR